MVLVQFSAENAVVRARTPASPALPEAPPPCPQLPSPCPSSPHPAPAPPTLPPRRALALILPLLSPPHQVGAEIRTFLLERSRVVSAGNAGERAYHIMYQVCA